MESKATDELKQNPEFINIVKEFDRDEESFRKLAYAYVDGEQIIIE